MDSDLQEEHHRLLRALHDSINRESALLQQVRRMKEAMAAAGLKLQLSVKVAHDEELTMRTLRKEALEARKEAIVANKRAATALELVQSLRLELHALRRQLSVIGDNGTAVEQDIRPGSNSPLRRSDAEVDAMMAHLRGKSDSLTNAGDRLGSSQSMRFGSSQGVRVPSRSEARPTYTPFQEWKIQRFLWTPDTPYASEALDAEAVAALAATALRESCEVHTAAVESRLQRSIKSSAAKTRVPVNLSILPEPPIDLEDEDEEADPLQEILASQGLENSLPYVDSPKRRRRRSNSVTPSIARAQTALDKLIKVDEDMQRFLGLGNSNTQGDGPRSVSMDSLGKKVGREKVPTLKSTPMVALPQDTTSSNGSLAMSSGSKSRASPSKLSGSVAVKNHSRVIV